MKPSTAVCLVILSIVLLLVADSSLLVSPINAASSYSAASLNSGAMANPETLLQYEWPQFQGDSSFSRSSAGPAPEAPDILWKINVAGVQSYVTAFNGKIFVTNPTQVIALDKDTGKTVWTANISGADQWPTVYKIDSTHLIAGGTCLDIETGRVIWVSSIFSSCTQNFGAGCYSPEEKMFYIKTSSSVQAWNFSDPSQPPTLAWDAFVPGGGSTGSGVQYGDGKVFPGSLLPHQIALDAKNGSLLWDTGTKSAMLFAGSYYDGKFLRGGSHDNTYYCFNASNGKILWTFNADSPDGYWATGSAADYGLVFATNMDGCLYALDANTGTLVWKYKSPGGLYFPGYPTVADGKVYVTTSQVAAADNSTVGISEFACFDAFTGKVVWTLPVEAYAPRESVAVAYGNLYLIPGYIKTGSMDTYTVPSEVWALGTQSWSMYLKDAQHSSTGQAGPANLTLRWNYTTGGAVTSSPAAADGKVYVGSQDHYVYCFNARTGSLVWKFKTDARIESSPAIYDGRLFIVSDDGYLYSLNASIGSLLWKQYIGSDLQKTSDSIQQIHSSPTIFGDKIYVGSLDSNLYCINVQNGVTVWTFQTAGPITSSPAVNSNSVYITSQESQTGGLYCVDAYSGLLQWRLDLLYSETYPPSMSGSPLICDGTVYLSANGHLYAVNDTLGTVTWMYQSSGFVGSPVHEAGNLFVTDASNIVCLNAHNGSLVWSVVLGAHCFSAPSFADGKLYLASDTRNVYVVNATDGQKLSWFTLGSNVWSSPTVYEGRLYVADQDWNLYCLANYPPIASSVSLTLAKTDTTTDELVTGWGQLNPGLENATITLTLVNSDGASRTIDVVTSGNGKFTFTLLPAAVGNWSVSAQWESDKGFYLSASSPKVTLTITSPPTPTPTETPPPTESPTPSPSPSETPVPFEKLTLLGLPLMDIYILVILVLIALIATMTYIYKKKLTPLPDSTQNKKAPD